MCFHCNAEIKKGQQHFVLENKLAIYGVDDGSISVRMCCPCYFKNYNLRRTKEYDINTCIMCDKLVHIYTGNIDEGPFFYQFSESMSGKCISVCDDCWGKNA